MYSRTFSEKPHLPPEYGGTALSKDEEREHARCKKEPPCPPPEPQAHKPCDIPGDPPCGDSGEHRPPTPPARGLLSHLLPFDIKSDDLLLLGIALLLLNDGCEDEYLPLLLLFLLIIH